MPTLELSTDVLMHYRVDDFTDPWQPAEAVLMLHGNCESGLAWYGWVPHLARHYRVIRPDMRGFGESTPMPRNFAWTLDIIIDDFTRLLDALCISRCHLVGAKIGGVIGRVFAARRADRIATLTIAGSPPPVRADRHTLVQRVREVEEHGVGHWARRSMASRLGRNFPPAGIDWWIGFMGRMPVSSEAGFLRDLNFSDITTDMPGIRCPTLVITTEHSDLATVEQTGEWQRLIPGSELAVLPGDSFHVAATDPDRCAEITLDFIARHPA